MAAHLVAGQRSREKAHSAVLQELGLEPLLDLRMRAGEGVGAVLLTQLLISGLAGRSPGARPGELSPAARASTAPGCLTNYDGTT